MKTSILTGEMAKLHNVSKETLRYYHQIGLLVPDFVDDKGYRHYSIRQFAHLDSILFLRELGLSIQEIQDFFKHRTLDTMLELLKEKNISIEDELQRLLKRQKAITTKIQLLEDYKRSNQEVCTLKYLPERHISRLPLKTYKGISDFEFGLKALNQSLVDNLSLFKGMIGVSLNAEHISKAYFGKWDSIILVFDDYEEHDLQVLPQGQYATLTYSGTYEDGDMYYEKLLSWLEDHNFNPDGDCLFLTISDSAFSNDPKEYINEIQIKIK